ncbi:Secretion monitor [[Pantoea] beijingensis]|uniref:Secretion monitor n=1 Tax=[Pantoea] beijingensis TaxID=1324864 RepID=A0A443I8V0_9GAMM|nr:MULTISPECIES: secA translation cis-regulator SecM [Erwiniaceae]RWR00524.1 Secretion monitor [[Pantoea] beijingensis]
MIGIFNRWRQLGRRYFWPHLLLGMVAASFGLPNAIASKQSTLPASASSTQSTANAVRFDRLALLQESARRPNFNVDYWHQHAIRTVIRHLSFTALTPQHLDVAEQALPLEVQKIALLDTLNALLTHESRAAAIGHDSEPSLQTASPDHQVGLWLAQVQGIRAGPVTLV